MGDLPRIVLIGRPNVGKSTLFNRLIGRRDAIVHDLPGVTRDRREATAEFAGRLAVFVDTAGLEEAGSASLAGRMRQQTEQALANADAALFMIDARAGVTPLDSHFAAVLRKQSCPVILVANKCEGRAGQHGLYDAYALGLGDPVPVSAEHGEGLADLAEALLPHIGMDVSGEDSLSDHPATGVAEPAETDAPVRLAIVGRPNVGKSTLVNRLIGEDRLLVGPEAGITRDSILIPWQWRGRPVELVDTAGLRRRSRVENGLERLAGAQTVQSLNLAHVVVLLLEPDGVLDRQDLTIARRIVDEGRALVVAINKWDVAAAPSEALERLNRRLETSLPQVRGVPTVTLSALTGRNLDRLMQTVFEIYSLWNSRVSTAGLNRWLEAAVSAHPPPLGRLGRRIAIRYATQVKARPPTFSLFGSSVDELPEAYLRYLVNALRDDFDLEGVPIRLLKRKGRNPYAPSAKRRKAR